MKKIFKISGLKEFFNKKENIAVVAVAAVFCAGLIVTELKAGEIPLHDGDVLVDSRTATQAEEPEGDTLSTQTEQPENEMEDVTEKTENETAPEDGTDIFSGKRAELELQRNSILKGYEDTIRNSSSEAEKKNAVQQKTKLLKYMEQEVAVESLISSRNLPESLVIITESTVTVTVDEQDLKQNTAARICSLVMEETGRSADKIIIQSYY